MAKKKNKSPRKTTPAVSSKTEEKKVVDPTMNSKDGKETVIDPATESKGAEETVILLSKPPTDSQKKDNFAFRVQKKLLIDVSPVFKDHFAKAETTDFELLHEHDDFVLVNQFVLWLSDKKQDIGRVRTALPHDSPSEVQDRIIQKTALYAFAERYKIAGLINYMLDSLVRPEVLHDGQLVFPTAAMLTDILFKVPRLTPLVQILGSWYVYHTPALSHIHHREFQGLLYRHPHFGITLITLLGVKDAMEKAECPFCKDISILHATDYGDWLDEDRMEIKARVTPQEKP